MNYSVFNHLQDSVVVINQKKNVLYANPAAARLCGFSADQVPAQTPVFHLITFENENLFCMPDGTLGQDEVFDGVEISFESCTGETGKAWVSILPQKEGAIVFIRNSKAQAQTRENIENLQKLATIGQFVGGILHEMSNPLSVIISSSELIQKNSQATPNFAPLAGINKLIQTSAQKMLHYTKLFKSFVNHPVNGQTFSVTDTKTLIQNCIDFTGYLARKNGINITAKIDSQIPPIYVDASAIQQALVNLLKNSIEAHGPLNKDGLDRNAWIRITATFNRTEKNLQISIEDNGPGISENHRKSLFTPFFTTKTEGHGLGLGLSVCNDIAEKHQGSIRFSPTEPTGACFTLTLPVRDAAIAAGSTVAAQTKLSAVKVLVVDDEAPVRLILKKLLLDLGCEVFEAEDGEQGLAEAQKIQPNIIMIDMVMPKMNGNQLATKLQTTLPKAKRILISGASIGPDELGPFDAILEKPFQADNIYTTLTSILY